MLCILKGAYRFFTVLVNELSSSRSECTSKITVEFIRIKSYENTTSTGKIEIMGLSILDDLAGKNVLVRKILFKLVFFGVEYNTSLNST